MENSEGTCLSTGEVDRYSKARLWAAVGVRMHVECRKRTVSVQRHLFLSLFYLDVIDMQH